MADITTNTPEVGTLNKADSARVIALSQKLHDVINNSNSTKAYINELKTFAGDAQELVGGIKSGNITAIKENIDQLSGVLEKNKVVGADIHKAHEIVKDIAGSVTNIIQDVNNIHFDSALKDIQDGNIVGLISDVQAVDIKGLIEFGKTTLNDVSSLKDTLKDGFEKFTVFYKEEIFPTLHAIKIQFEHNALITKVENWEKSHNIEEKVHKFFSDVENKFSSVFGHKIKTDTKDAVAASKTDLHVKEVEKVVTEQTPDGKTSETHSSELHVTNTETSTVEAH